MNDNHSPRLAAALEAVQDMPSFTEAHRNCIKVAVRDTTASGGSHERPLSLLTCLLTGGISLAVVWFLIGPAWVAAIDRLAGICP
jgi:hypothetical protein